MQVHPLNLQQNFQQNMTAEAAQASASSASFDAMLQEARRASVDAKNAAASGDSAAAAAKEDKALREALESLRGETATTVFYESPRRVLDTVRLMAEILGSRRLVIARELTKTFESFYDHPADEMASFLAEDPDRQKGEFVIMVAGADAPEEGAVSAEAERILKVLLPLMPMRKAAKAAAEITGLRGNDLYEAALRLSGKDS